MKPLEIAIITLVLIAVLWQSTGVKFNTTKVEVDK